MNKVEGLLFACSYSKLLFKPCQHFWRLTGLWEVWAAPFFHVGYHLSFLLHLKPCGL